jgi:alpha-L-arabinofuranosidase
VLGGKKLPSVSASASKDAQGKIHLSIVNTRPSRDEEITCDLRGLSPQTITGRILTGPEITAHNTFDKPSVVEPKAFEGARIVDGKLHIQLPAKSVLMLDLE